jgi:hypothetical protein
MAFLTGNLKTEQLLDPPYNGKQYMLLEGVRYRLKGHDYHAPAGFICDLTSMPRPARVLFNKEGRHTLAAVIHDRLYQTQEVTRDVADYIFYRAMLDCYVPPKPPKSKIRRLMVAIARKSYEAKCLTLWMGVKAGGWIAWNRHKRNLRDG